MVLTIGPRKCKSRALTTWLLPLKLRTQFFLFLRSSRKILGSLVTHVSVDVEAQTEQALVRFCKCRDGTTRRFTRGVQLLSRENLNMGNRIAVMLRRPSSLGCSLKSSVAKRCQIFSNYMLTTSKIQRQSGIRDLICKINYRGGVFQKLYTFEVSVTLHFRSFSDLKKRGFSRVIEGGQ